MNPNTPVPMFQISTRYGVEYRGTLVDAQRAAKSVINKDAPIVAIVAPDGTCSGYFLEGGILRDLATVNVASFGWPFLKPYAVESRNGFVVTEHDTEAEALAKAQTRCSASDTRTTVYGPGVGRVLATFTWDSWANEAREEV